MVGYYNDWLFYVVTIVRMSGDVIKGMYWVNEAFEGS